MLNLRPQLPACHEEAIGQVTSVKGGEISHEDFSQGHEVSQEDDTQEDTQDEDSQEDTQEDSKERGQDSPIPQEDSKKEREVTKDSQD